ncbi:MAG: thermonuclease family protein [Bacteroidota bacterium]
MYQYNAFVTSVYDGDTITCDIDLGFYTSLKKQKFRLQGLDAPELRGAERTQGLTSRDKLRELILGKEVIIHSLRDRKEKYGRWLAIVYTMDGINVNEYLIKHGFAVRVYE